ncbi:MAG: glycosyltransferase family protein [Pseudomonadota bacterium]
MSRILYGVSGEGAGHSSRAREMVPHLMSRGHDVRLVSYDRGLRVLDPLFGCTPIAGLHIVSRDNRVRPWRTLGANLVHAGALLDSVRRVRAVIRSFRPDVVITDFEPVTAWLARLHGIPLVSLDNQHRMRYMDFETPVGMASERRTAQWIVRCMVPSPDVALATTYFRGEVRNRRTFLFPPILRGAVRRTVAVEGDHHLVYLTNHYDGLLDVLRCMPEHQFTVYGCDRQGTEGNLRYRPFSDGDFLDDLASARSVIGTAGFTLISEALYLGKPYLAFPMQGQFEQQLNAQFLARQGYGMNAAEGSEEVVRGFLACLPQYRRALAQSARQGMGAASADNREIREFLDRLLSDDCRLVRQFRDSRGKRSTVAAPVSVTAD